MTRDEFVSLAERELQAILMRGYVTKETDAGQLFRMMCNDARLLRDKLGEIYTKLPKPEGKR